MTDVANVVAVERSIIVIGSEQGPPGPPGASGSAGVSIVTKPAGVTLGGHRAVCLNPAGTAFVYADNTDVGLEACVYGVTQGSTLVGADVTVQTAGEITEPTWSWTPRAPIYLGANGYLTQTPPSSGFLIQVGFAATATTMVLAVHQSILLGG